MERLNSIHTRVKITQTGNFQTPVNSRKMITGEIYFLKFKLSVTISFRWYFEKKKRQKRVVNMSKVDVRKNHTKHHYSSLYLKNN